MVRRRPGVERARRGGADLAVDRRLLRHRGHGARHRRRPRARRAGLGQPARRCGWTPSPWARRREIQKVRRTGLTFAPEGGTWRMRTVINKLITEEDLYGAVDAAFSQGWRRVKLYFLIGLPTERDEDVLGIAELGARCVEIGRRYHKAVTVVASVGGFVPKPHTPFQWFGQDTVAELERKVALLRDAGPAHPGPHHPLARAGGVGRRGAGQPGRPPHGRRDRAGLAGRRHLPGVVRALRPRPVGGGPGRRGAQRRGGVPPGPRRRTRPCPGTTSRRACTGTSSGATGRTRWPRRGRRGLPLDPLLRLRRLHRTSGSSTWWPPRSRRPAGARAPGRT